jgi:hypothetical protein
LFVGLGIKLEDVPEILIVCATNLEEEITLKDLAMEVVQVLYEYGKRNDEEFADLDARYRSMRPTSALSASRGGETNNGFDNTFGTRSNSTLNHSWRGSESGQSDLEDPDNMFATKVLKFEMLKSITSINRISQNAFIKCVTRHPLVMKEFGKQVIRFRELITPYQVGGSITYEDSLQQNSTYGTVSHSQVS